MDFKRLDRKLVIETAAWLAVAGFFYFFSFDILDTTQTYRFGAAAWPRAIVGAMLLVAVFQVVLGFLRSAPKPAETAETEPQETGFAGSAVFRLGITLGTPLLYIFLLPRTGFYLTTPVFIAVYLFLLGERQIVPLVLISLFVYAMVTLVFTTLFFVALPVGNWPGFYDFSNWFITAIR